MALLKVLITTTMVKMRVEITTTRQHVERLTYREMLRFVRNAENVQNEDQGGQAESELARANPCPVDEFEEILDDGCENAGTLRRRRRWHVPALTPPSGLLADGVSWGRLLHSTQRLGRRWCGLSTWEPNTRYTPVSDDSIAITRAENIYFSGLHFIHDFLNDTVEDKISKRKHDSSTEGVKTTISLLGLGVVQKNLKSYDFWAGKYNCA